MTVGGEMGKIGDDQFGIAHLTAELRGFLVRALEKLIQDSQLKHHFQGGRVNGVTAKVTEKVAVFFEHARLNTSAG
jgi:hypothetical protein